MAEQVLGGLITKEQKKMFAEEGYLVLKELLRADEVSEIKETFMQMHAGGPIPGCFRPLPPEEAGDNILKQYPRMMHPHRVNDVALRYMIHAGIMNALADLFDEEPLAAQSMFYFKPPGAKGQALHQDNYYLKVEPGTCIAAWVAVDPADRENGGMMVVPQSNNLPVECPHLADPELSFTRDEVDVPEGMQAVSVDLQAGDVLFFNGSVIHGSYPNRSKERFRRAFIGHYVGKSTEKIGKHYNDLYTHDGQILHKEENDDDGPCGGEEFKRGGEFH
jgi:phytanoyl-CoA hydroxylase